MICFTLLWQVITTSTFMVSSVLADLALQRRDPTCETFTIPVTASASTKSNIAVPASLNDSSVFIDFILSEASSVLGTPETVVISRSNTIQYLQHAITDSKEYWSGLSYPKGFDGNTYSWIQYATSQGYPVLAVDNLGSGGSDHPDPISVVQQTLQVEIIHQIITMLREGTIPFSELSGLRFSKVIFVGHSYGSIIGNAIATRHPTDIDVLILTGYSAQFILGLGPLGAGIAIPAALAMPSRFSGLSPGYLAQTVQAGRQEALYTNVGGFDPNIVTYDFNHQGTVALGELATLFSGLGPADAFLEDVYVLTGEQDAICCNSLLGVSNCGSGPESTPAEAEVFFPAARNYTVHIPNLTGHSPNMHYSAPSSFALVHDYLADRGY